MFITFEGIDGCGKTTQTELVYRYFKEKKFDIILTKEPGGGSDFSTKIREALKSTEGNLLLSELLAIYAARNEHVKKVIKPAIDGGKTIICDRYVDSSFAYYLYDKLTIKDGKIIKTDEYYKCYNDILTLNKIIEIIEPDLTFLFNIETEEATKRINVRNLFRDKYDDFGDAKMSLISYIFNDICEEREKNNTIGRKIVKIDASKKISEVFDEITRHILNHIQNVISKK